MKQFKFCYEKKEAAKFKRNAQGTCWRGVPLKVGDVVLARDEKEAAALEGHPLFVDVTPKEEKRAK
jgi:hypothetical protein